MLAGFWVCILSSRDRLGFYAENQILFFALFSLRIFLLSLPITTFLFQRSPFNDIFSYNLIHIQFIYLKVFSSLCLHIHTYYFIFINSTSFQKGTFSSNIFVKNSFIFLINCFLLWINVCNKLKKKCLTSILASGSRPLSPSSHPHSLVVKTNSLWLQLSISGGFQ